MLFIILHSNNIPNTIESFYTICMNTKCLVHCKYKFCLHNRFQSLLPFYTEFVIFPNEERAEQVANHKFITRTLFANNESSFGLDKHSKIKKKTRSSRGNSFTLFIVRLNAGIDYEIKFAFIAVWIREKRTKHLHFA